MWTAVCSLASHWNCCSSKLLSVLLLLYLSFVCIKFPFYFLNKEYTLIPLQALSSLFVILQNTGLNILQYRLNKDLNKEIILDFMRTEQNRKTGTTRLVQLFFSTAPIYLYKFTTPVTLTGLTQSPS